MTPRIAVATAAILVLSLVLLFAGFKPGEAGSPFVVNSTGDASDANIGNNVCATAGAVCTQRAAMEEANAAPEIHDIYYNLPGCPGAGCEINVASALPSLTRDFMMIDGSTQPGYTGEPLVVIDGGLAGASANGFHLQGDSITVKGLEIRDFSFHGIMVGDVGGTGPWVIRENLIAQNDLSGIDLVVYCIGETTITGNSILDNGIGISSCGPDIIASFNRLFSNTTAGMQDQGFSEFALAENNWWGCNEGPTVATDCDLADDSIGALDYDPWLVLRIKAVPNSIPGGGTSNLSGLLVINSDSDDTSGPNWVLDGTPMTFETDLGSVGSQIVVKETSAGGAGATLTADEGPGTANVSVAVDLEEVATTVEITSAPPTPSPTPSPTPTATDTPTPTPSASPTPSATPGPDLTQGDVDCDDDVDSQDGAKLLAHVADVGYSQQPDCPAIGANVASLFGDVNCADGVNAVDALAIFAHVAGVPIDNGACTDIGQPM